VGDAWRAGIGDGIIPPNLDLALMDGIVVVSTDDALAMAHRLAREEGMLCGPSSGMNVVAALKVADKHPELTRLVTVIADTGQRYLSGSSSAKVRSPKSPTATTSWTTRRSRCSKSIATASSSSRRRRRLTVAPRAAVASRA
jgi:threonine synthase